MVLIRRFILMIQFLTRIPVPIKIDAKDEDYGKGLIFAPLAGLLIGGILAGAWYLLSFIFPAYINAVVVIVIYVAISGGIHLDGLGDTMDGIFSGRPREKMLEIMRDSRIGTYALLGIVSVLLLDMAFIFSLENNSIIKILILMPVAGRVGSLIGAGISKYARSGSGLGKAFIDNCGISEILYGLSLYLIPFILIIWPGGILLSLVPVIAAYITTKLLTRKLGGATGDILGAVCEINQVIFLAAAFVMRGI